MSYVQSNSEVLTQQQLSALAIEYTPAGFIGPALCSVIPVTKPAGKFRTRDKANALALVNVEMGDLGNPAELSGGYGSANFSTEVYGAEERIPVAFEQAADASINLQIDVAKQLKSTLMLAQESRIATLFQATGSYASDNVETLSGSDQWSDENSDPFTAIDTRMGAIYASPSAKKIGWAGYDVWLKLKNHPAILERIKYTGGSDKPALVTRQAFASLFGLDDFLVGEVRATSTNPGQSTKVYSRIWGKNFGVAAVEPGQSTMFLGFAALFEFEKPMIDSWLEKRPGLKGATVMKMTHAVDEVIVANDAGILFASAVA